MLADNLNEFGRFSELCLLNSLKFIHPGISAALFPFRFFRNWAPPLSNHSRSNDSAELIGLTLFQLSGPADICFWTLNHDTRLFVTIITGLIWSWNVSACEPQSVNTTAAPLLSITIKSRSSCPASRNFFQFTTRTASAYDIYWKYNKSSYSFIYQAINSIIFNSIQFDVPIPVMPTCFWMLFISTNYCSICGISNESWHCSIQICNPIDNS